jgi:hypothetical protein
MGWPVLVGKMPWLRQKAVSRSADPKTNKMQGSRFEVRGGFARRKEEAENAYRERKGERLG